MIRYGGFGEGSKIGQQIFGCELDDSMYNSYIQESAFVIRSCSSSIIISVGEVEVRISEIERLKRSGGNRYNPAQPAIGETEMQQKFFEAISMQFRV